jgi:uncharacterized protein (DUF362 family)
LHGGHIASRTLLGRRGDADRLPRATPRATQWSADVSGAVRLIESRRVAIHHAPALTTYPRPAPFHPSESYPEWPRSERAATPNGVYAGVRDLFVQLGYDVEQFGTDRWNPLGWLIRPGMTVLLKPNMVRDFHDLGEDVQTASLVTDGSLLRAVVDYVYIALHGEGRVLIADSPHSDCRWERLLEILGWNAIREYYASRLMFELEAYDLRPEYVVKRDGVLVDRIPLPGDPKGYVAVNLGRDSCFAGVERKLRGAEYDLTETRAHHHGDVHEYPICGSVLAADVMINLPKLKSHKKAGVTLSLKNMIGINGHKNWLPHHSEGTPRDGGDQFDSSSLKNRLEYAAVQAFKEHFPRLGPLRKMVAAPVKSAGRAAFGDTNKGRVRSGNWWGNDTIWRTCLDLMRANLYADRDGRMRETPQRGHLSIVDGVVGGEGNGPLAPVDHPCGLLIAGENPAAVDAVCTRVMGFDIERIPIVVRAFDTHRYPLATFRSEEVECVSAIPRYACAYTDLPPDFPFEPHFGWTGHIELART